MSGLVLYGFAMSVVAGILAGGGAAPIKWMHRYDYEHWALIRAVVGLILLPWLFFLLACPDGWQALLTVDRGLLIKANLFSFAWGVACVLASLCLLRIGFSLTIGLLTGIGLPIGVVLPMIFRGSGQFAEAPGLWTRSGLLILVGVGVMIAGVALIVMAGFGRDRSTPEKLLKHGSFRVGLLMASMAGLLQVGLSFAFVYSQGPISEVLMERGASAASANIGVWAATLLGGALVNLGHPLWLLQRKKSWAVLLSAPRDLLLSVLIGLAFFLFIMALGTGMRWLGALGASVGFGVYQAAQIASSQSVGLLGKEWHGIASSSRRQMAWAVGLMLVAVMVIAAGRATATVSTPPESVNQPAAQQPAGIQQRKVTP